MIGEVASIMSPLVEYTRATKMAEPTQACINPSARINKGDNVCVSSFTFWRHDVARSRMILAASSTNVLSGATSIGGVGGGVNERQSFSKYFSIFVFSR